MPSNPRPNPSLGLSSQKGPLCYMATSANITYGKLYIIGKSKLCWFQTCVNDVGRLSGREDMTKTKVALNPRLRLQIFRVTVKRPSKVGQRKVRSLVRNRNKKDCNNSNHDSTIITENSESDHTVGIRWGSGLDLYL